MNKKSAMQSIMMRFYAIWRVFVEDESILIMLVQQYAGKHGITFSSKHLDDPEKKKQLITLIQESLAGKRGPVTDDDLL
jgi:hypothetical protein